MASLFYGLAGIFLASFIKTPPIFSGAQYLLGTVAAVVLGGTALGGGIGSFIATVGGALFLSQLSAIVLGVGLPNSLQQVVQALAIVLVVGLRSVPWHRLRSLVSSGPPSGGTPITSGPPIPGGTPVGGSPPIPGGTPVASGPPTDVGSESEVRPPPGAA